MSANGQIIPPFVIRLILPLATLLLKMHAYPIRAVNYSQEGGEAR